jgi:hypothetical protein
MTRIDISSEIKSILDKFGLDKEYVYSMTFVPGMATIDLHMGRDGRCKGPRYLIDADGEIVTPRRLPDGTWEVVDGSVAERKMAVDVARETVRFAIGT